MAASTLTESSEDAASPNKQAIHPRRAKAAPNLGVTENNGLLSISAALVGVLSYACTLLMANTLGSAQFSDFAAAQMLLGIVGTIASALVPLQLSHAVATYPESSSGRRDGLAFALLVSLIAGSAAATITGVVTATFAAAPLALAVAFSSLMLFVVAAPQGWLQGQLRFKHYAVVSLGEVAVRLAFSLLVVALAWGATGAIAGFAVGALIILVVPRSFYRDARWRPHVLTERWRWFETGDIAAVLCVVSTLVGMDVVVVAVLDPGSDIAAGFQALATIAKGPVYIAAGTALVAFPLLRRRGADTVGILRDALRSYTQLALAAAAVIATVPGAIMGLVLPARYAAALELLPWLAVAGLGYATLTVLATVLLALRKYRKCQLGLLAAALLITGGLIIGWQLDGVVGLAIGCALGSLLGSTVVIVLARAQLPVGTNRMALVTIAAAASLMGVLKVASAVPILWLLGALFAGFTVLALQRGEMPSPLHMLDTVRQWWKAHKPSKALPPIVSFISFLAVTAIAFGVRATGLTRAFELWVDEMLYAELGRAVSLGQLPNLPDGPFFLHPPGFFLVEGATINLLGLSGNSFDLVNDLRWLNALIGAISVGVAFLLVRKLTNVPIAITTAVVMAFEPFVLRNNSRVFIETLGMAAVLVGLLIIVYEAGRQPSRFSLLRIFLGGLILGYSVLTKDVFVLATAAPVILAVVWRRTLSLLHAATILVGSAIPYVAYLIVLGISNMFPNWLWAKTQGISRFLGHDQITGFNAEGSPSLISRLIEQAETFGTSYVLLGLGPVAAIFVCLSPVKERRLIGLVGLTMGLFGVYSAAFGTFEEQYGYPVMVAGILSIAVFGMELCLRRPQLIRATGVLGICFALLTMSLGLRAETTTDNGYAQFEEWKERHLPAQALVSVTNSTGELAFGDDPRFGVWPSTRLMEQNGVEYILTQSLPTMQGYGYARPEMLEWLTDTATKVVSFEGPTNGATTLWHVDEAELRLAVREGIGIPSSNYETEK